MELFFKKVERTEVVIGGTTYVVSVAKHERLWWWQVDVLVYANPQTGPSYGSQTRTRLIDRIDYGYRPTRGKAIEDAEKSIENLKNFRGE